MRVMPKIARLLDELGRVLAEVANGPEKMIPGGSERDSRPVLSQRVCCSRYGLWGRDVNSRDSRAEQSRRNECNTEAIRSYETFIPDICVLFIQLAGGSCCYAKGDAPKC